MLALLLAAPAAGIARVSSQAPSTDRIATLSPVAALPAHVAGSFEELTSCQQAPDEQLLSPLVADGLAIMAGLFWDLGTDDRPERL